jgi:cob(I)alamin adenosyltransferase
MSIITRTGDNGETSLMYNRRVSKCHPRIEACGCTDELTSFLGLARVTTSNPWVKEVLFSIQQDLIVLMGELATGIEDLPRYVMEGHRLITPEMTEKLERTANEVEQKLRPYHGWAIPGQTHVSAVLDIARAVCRRAERRICALHETGQLKNPEIIRFLNRLSDLLWLLARLEEVAS